MKTKQKLIEMVYNYLCYDLKLDNRWHDPSQTNKHWVNVKKDAENIVNLIIKEHGKSRTTS
jgi:hypothetical protein